MTHPVLSFIQEEFARRKAKNSRYSVRAFAQALGISSSALAQMLKGKRQLTFATARQILSQLDIDEPKRNALLLAFDNPKNYTPPANYIRVLTEQQLEVLAGWQFYAILCVLELPRQNFSDEEIALRLSCSLDLVQSSVQILMTLGLVQKEGHRYIPTGDKLTTTHNIPSPALVKAHRDYLNKATAALATEEIRKESDFSGITMAISKKKLPEAARRIREFRRSLAAFLGDGEKDEIYRINIQLFPLK